MGTNIGTKMFKKINNKCVHSSEGFKVEYINIHELRYVEENHEVAIEIEAGPQDFTVYAQKLTRWLPPHEYEIITSEKKEQIIKNIDAGLTFLEVPHVMHT